MTKPRQIGCGGEMPAGRAHVLVVLAQRQPLDAARAGVVGLGAKVGSYAGCIRCRRLHPEGFEDFPFDDGLPPARRGRRKCKAGDFVTQVRVRECISGSSCRVFGKRRQEGVVGVITRVGDTERYRPLSLNAVRVRQQAAKRDRIWIHTRTEFRRGKETRDRCIQIQCAARGEASCREGGQRLGGGCDVEWRFRRDAATSLAIGRCRTRPSK